MRFDRGRDEQKVKQWKKQTSKEIRLKSNFFRSYKLLQAVFSRMRDSSKIDHSFRMHIRNNFMNVMYLLQKCGFCVIKLYIGCRYTNTTFPV